MNKERIRLWLIDSNAKRTQCFHRPHAIIGSQHAIEPANTIGKRGDDHSAMRNAFVARHGNFGIDARSTFYAKFHLKIRRVSRLGEGGARAESIQYPARLSSAPVICDEAKKSSYGTKKIFLKSV